MKERRDHKDELSDAPELSKLGRKDPFQVPDSYFEGLEQRIKDEVGREEPQSQILANLGRKNVFQTPDNYFEDIIANFEKRKQSETENRSLRFKIVPFYFMAGIAAIIMLLFLFLTPAFFSSNSVELEFAELEEVSMEDLLAEVRPEELSEDMIMTTFDHGSWEDWIEEENERIEIQESEEEDIDEFIEELDVYTLEAELDNLN